MGKQAQKTRTKSEKTEEVEEAPPCQDKGTALKAEMDELLEEIDEVLESNAEEFVRAYIQKGGQ